MKAFSSDTSEAAQQFLLRGYRAMSCAEKLERVRQLTRGAQQMALVRLRREYPNADERELKLRLASLWLTADQMRAAFDWDPDVKGR